MYRFSLEKSSKKHKCPNCGRNTFVRVIDTETGSYLPEVVGRCDRESNCRYHYSWSDYFRDNPDTREERVQKGTNLAPRKESGLRRGCALKNAAKTVYSRGKKAAKTDYLELTHLLETLGGYDRNSFVQFLTRLFPDDPKAVVEAVRDYKVGTFGEWASFPTISRQGKFCKAKLMKFDPVTGKRLRGASGAGVVHSLQAKLKNAGRLKLEFETDKDVFFGEHLLTKYPHLQVAIVEAEKTAVLASMYGGSFPNWFGLPPGRSNGSRRDESRGWDVIER